MGLRRGAPALLLACAGLLAFAAARAATTPRRASLAHVDSVAVRVAMHGRRPIAWPDAARLAAKVVLRLRETGVPILDPVSARPTPGVRLLDVRIDVMRRAPRDTIANVPFRCEVSLVRVAPPGANAVAPSATEARRRATLWTRHEVAYESADGGREELFETLDEEVDAFASDWLAAHPRH